MLILTRRIGESILIDLARPVPGLGADALFGGGPLQIKLTWIARHQAKLAVHADPRLRVLRAELTHHEPSSLRKPQD